MNRYTDRDCYAAMIRACAAIRAMTSVDLGVSIPTPGNRPWAKDLEKFAENLKVPIRRFNAPGWLDGPRIILERVSKYYGGGVRPMICDAGHTGENTPEWWVPSAGLGPGAVPRKVFCYILGAVEGLAKWRNNR